VRTALVTATLGGRGTTGGLCSAEELPRVREQELRDAARVLQFDALEILPTKTRSCRMRARRSAAPWWPPSGASGRPSS
jgi:LmbE family N-acetylglucosaminyl deacetylase